MARAKFGAELGRAGVAFHTPTCSGNQGDRGALKSGNQCSRPEPSVSRDCASHAGSWPGVARSSPEKPGGWLLEAAPRSPSSSWASPRRCRCNKEGGRLLHRPPAALPYGPEVSRPQFSANLILPAYGLVLITVPVRRLLASLGSSAVAGGKHTVRGRLGDEQERGGEIPRPSLFKRVALLRHLLLGLLLDSLRNGGIS